MVSARLRIRLRRTSELITIWITDVDSIDHFNVKSSLFYTGPFNTCTQLNKASQECLKQSPSSYLTLCFTTLFLLFFQNLQLFVINAAWS